MNFKFPHFVALSALAVLLVACETPEPQNPRRAIPGPQTYYNEALNFSLNYPKVLNLKVEDRGTVDMPSILLRLQYPGNDFQVLELATHDPGMADHFRTGMLADSERVTKVGEKIGKRFAIEDPAEDSAGDGTIQRVIVENFGRLYVFTGRSDTFDEVIDTFEFIETPPEEIEP